MEVIIVSLVGVLAFGGVFLLLGPEWWSSSLGTLKHKKKSSVPPRPDGARNAFPRVVQVPAREPEAV